MSINYVENFKSLLNKYHTVIIDEVFVDYKKIYEIKVISIYREGVRGEYFVGNAQNIDINILKKEISSINIISKIFYSNDNWNYKKI